MLKLKIVHLQQTIKYINNNQSDKLQHKLNTLYNNNKWKIDWTTRPYTKSNRYKTIQYQIERP